MSQTKAARMHPGAFSQVQNYKYDKKDQLLGVYDDKGNAIEEYVYDPAGNILKKTV